MFTARRSRIPRFGDLVGISNRRPSLLVGLPNAAALVALVQTADTLLRHFETGETPSIPPTCNYSRSPGKAGHVQVWQPANSRPTKPIVLLSCRQLPSAHKHVAYVRRAATPDPSINPF